jgi:hypothetical protein
MKVNVNNEVKIRLTDEGRKILMEAHDKRNEEHNGAFGDYAPPREDQFGWSTWQLWHLMREFGPHMYNGCKVPFEAEIELLGV